MATPPKPASLVPDIPTVGAVRAASGVAIPPAPVVAEPQGDDLDAAYAEFSARKKREKDVAEPVVEKVEDDLDAAYAELSERRRVQAAPAAPPAAVPSEAAPMSPAEPAEGTAVSMPEVPVSSGTREARGLAGVRYAAMDPSAYELALRQRIDLARARFQEQNPLASQADLDERLRAVETQWRIAPASRQSNAAAEMYLDSKTSPKGKQYALELLFPMPTDVILSADAETWQSRARRIEEGGPSSKLTKEEAARYDAATKKSLDELLRNTPEYTSTTDVLKDVLNPDTLYGAYRAILASTGVLETGVKAGKAIGVLDPTDADILLKGAATASRNYALEDVQRSLDSGDRKAAETKFDSLPFSQLPPLLDPKRPDVATFRKAYSEKPGLFLEQDLARLENALFNNKSDERVQEILNEIPQEKLRLIQPDVGLPANKLTEAIGVYNEARQQLGYNKQSEAIGGYFSSIMNEPVTTQQGVMYRPSTIGHVMNLAGITPEMAYQANVPIGALLGIALPGGLVARAGMAASGALGQKLLSGTLNAVGAKDLSDVIDSALIPTKAGVDTMIASRKYDDVVEALGIDPEKYSRVHSPKSTYLSRVRAAALVPEAQGPGVMQIREAAGLPENTFAGRLAFGIDLGADLMFEPEHFIAKGLTAPRSVTRAWKVSQTLPENTRLQGAFAAAAPKTYSRVRAMRKAAEEGQTITEAIRAGGAAAAEADTLSALHTALRDGFVEEIKRGENPLKGLSAARRKEVERVVRDAGIKIEQATSDLDKLVEAVSLATVDAVDAGIRKESVANRGKTLVGTLRESEAYKARRGELDDAVRLGIMSQEESDAAMAALETQAHRFAADSAKTGFATPEAFFEQVKIVTREEPPVPPTAAAPTPVEPPTPAVPPVEVVPTPVEPAVVVEPPVAVEPPVEVPAPVEPAAVVPPTPAAPTLPASPAPPEGIQPTWYRGFGREEPGAIYTGATTPILGGGRYYATTPDAAKFYGPELETREIRPKNPLVIRSDDQWRALTREAGWQFPNPFGTPPEEMAGLTAQLEDLLRQRGHDAVYIILDEVGDSTRTLDKVFGESQAFVPSWADEAAAPTAPAVPETPKAPPVAAAPPAEPPLAGRKPLTNDAIETGLGKKSMPLRKAMDFIIARTDNPFHKRLAERLLQVGGRFDDATFQIVQGGRDGMPVTQGMKPSRVTRFLKGTRTSAGAYGVAFAFPKGGPPPQVFLSGSKFGPVKNMEVTILHEALHVATHERYVLALDAGAPPELKAARDQIRNLTNQVRKYIKGLSPDALKKITDDPALFSSMKLAVADPLELITYGFTDEKFRAFLKTVPVSKPKGALASAWSEFVSAVADLVGIKRTDTNALASLIESTEQLMSVPSEKLPPPSGFVGKAVASLSLQRAPLEQPGLPVALYARLRAAIERLPEEIKPGIRTVLDGIVAKTPGVVEGRVRLADRADEVVTRAIRERLGGELPDGEIRELLNLNEKAAVDSITRQELLEELDYRGRRVTETPNEDGSSTLLFEGLGEEPDARLVVRMEMLDSGANALVIEAADFGENLTIRPIMAKVASTAGARGADAVVFRVAGAEAVQATAPATDALVFTTVGDIGSKLYFEAERLGRESTAAPSAYPWVVASRNGKTVGAAYASLGNNRTLFKFDIIVSPDAQGMGVGERLLDQVIAHYKDLAKENPSLVADAEVVSPVMKRMLERRGFTERAPRRDFMGFLEPVGTDASGFRTTFMEAKAEDLVRPVVPPRTVEPLEEIVYDTRVADADMLRRADDLYNQAAVEQARALDALAKELLPPGLPTLAARGIVAELVDINTHPALAEMRRLRAEADDIRRLSAPPVAEALPKSRAEVVEPTMPRASTYALLDSGLAMATKAVGVEDALDGVAMRRFDLDPEMFEAALPEDGIVLFSSNPVQPTPARAVIDLVNNGSFAGFVQEDAKLLRTLGGDLWTDSFLSNFDHNVVLPDGTVRPGVVGKVPTNGSPMLTNLGTRQFEASLHTYLTKPRSASGPLRAAFDKFYTLMQVMYLKARGITGDPTFIQMQLDALMRPDELVRNQVAVVLDTPLYGVDTIYVKGTLEEQMAASVPRSVGKSQETYRTSRGIEDLRQILNIKKGDKTVNLADVFAEAYAHVLLTEARRNMDVLGRGQRIVRVGTRSAVPEDRLPKIQKRLANRLSALNVDARRFEVDPTNRNYLLIDEASRPGIRALVKEIQNSWYSDFLPAEVTRPGFDASRIHVDVYDRVRELHKDLLAGPGSLRDRIAESVPTSVGYVLQKVMSDAASSIPTTDKWKRSLNETFVVNTIGSDVADPGVVEIFDYARRSLGEVDKWIRKTADEISSNKPGALPQLVVQLADKLIPPLPLGVRLAPGELPSNLVKLRDLNELFVNGSAKPLEKIDKAIGDAVSVQEMLDQLDNAEQLFLDFKPTGVPSMTDLERRALIEARRISDNLEAGIAFEELTDFDKDVLQDALNIIAEGIDSRNKIVDETAAAIAQAMFGGESKAALQAFSAPNVRYELYSRFYEGDWAGMFKFNTYLGLSVTFENFGEFQTRFSQSQAVLAMVGRLKAQQILTELSEKLALYGARSDMEWLTRNYKGIGSIKNRRDFVGNVSKYINAELAGSRWAIRDEAGKILNEDMVAIPHKDEELAAYVQANETLNRYGYKRGAQAMFEELLLSDGTKVQVPSVFAEEYKAALTRHTTLTGGFTEASALADRAPSSENIVDIEPTANQKAALRVAEERRNVMTVAGGVVGLVAGATVGAPILVGVGGALAARNLSKVLAAAVEGFDMTLRYAKVGLTTGLLVPNPAYYVANFVGGFFQAAAAVGSAQTIKAVFSEPRMVAAVIAEMTDSKAYHLSAKPLITTDGRVFTVPQIRRVAEAEGLSGSFVQAETVRSIADDLRRMEPTMTNKVLRPMRNWQQALTDVATSIDNYYRISLFIDELKNGKNATEAAATARKAAFDYTALTDAEKKYMRSVVLFYSFLRRNVDLFYDTAMTNPGRILAQLRMANYSRRALLKENAEVVEPSYLEGRVYLFVRRALQDQPDAGRVAVLLPELPAMDVMQLFASVLNYGTDKAARQDVLSRFAPIFQSPAVFAFEMEAFSGRQLGSYDKIPWWLYSMDLNLTGGVLTKGVFGAEPRQVNDPLTADREDTGTYMQATNAKLWWAWRNFLQFPGAGRSMSTLESIDYADAGIIETMVAATEAYRRQGGIDVLDDAFRAAGEVLPNQASGLPTIIEPDREVEEYAEMVKPREGFTTATERMNIFGVRSTRIPSEAVGVSKLYRELEQAHIEASKQLKKASPYRRE
jgi:GNAT superfamily N-acetyltransferase